MGKQYLTQDECKKTMLEIVKTIHSICKKNNINYFICSGTLLGAVRHSGFIPWDDDIDIALLRDDYEKLINILKEQKEYPWLEVIDLDNENCFYTFAKVVDNRTVAKQDDNLFLHGLWVDVFPVDNLPNSSLKQKIFIYRNYFKRIVVMSKISDFNSKGKLKHRYIKRILNIYSNMFNMHKYAEKYSKYCQKYRNKSTYYVGGLFSPYKLKECFERKVFEQVKEYKFENTKLYGPLYADTYLKSLYGDYMALPPKNKQKNHKIVAWKK